MTDELDIFNYQRFVVSLKNAARGLSYAAEFGDKEINAIFIRVKEIYEREREKCLQLIRKANLYPDYNL